MWKLNTLALLLVVALTPGAEGAALKVSNVRAAYSDLGPVRRDDSVLPGDIYFVAFDIDNVKVNKEGELKISMAMDVTDRNGKNVYNQDFKDMVQLNSLGGTRVPGFAHVIIGTSQP